MIQFQLGSTTIRRLWLPVNQAWAVWREDAPSDRAWQLRLHPTSEQAAADFEHRVAFLQTVVTLSQEARS